MLIIRKAKICDIEEVHRLITNYAENDLMLGRSRSMLYEGIREITVAEIDGLLVGAGMLHVMWDDLAEIRALAVHPDYTGQGIGRKMLEEFIAEAKELKIPRLFALTYQAGFFVHCGFVKVSKESLPQKMWRECIDCPKFPNCDEEAVQIDLEV